MCVRVCMDKSSIERLLAESHNLVHIGWVETDIMESEVINFSYETHIVSALLYFR